MKQKLLPATFMQFDFVLILSVISLIAVGIAFIYSSGVTSNGVQVSDEWSKQLIWAASGLVLMTVFAVIDYRRWKDWAIAVYLVSVILLGVVLIMGNYVKGARAWFGVGSVGVQPSEFGKIALIIILAWWYDEQGRNTDSLRSWTGGIILTSIPMLLVLVQPDLGTAIVYIPILLAVSFTAGIRTRYIMFALIPGFLIIAGTLGIAWNEYINSSQAGFFRLFTEPGIIKIIFPSFVALTILAYIGYLIFKQKLYIVLLYFFGIFDLSYLGTAAAYKVLKGYQMMRLVVFMDPQIDPRGAGWHIIQSVTAIGSGGATGKGFLHGTQSHYRYLPEQSTDFIFSIIAEETGFIGTLVVFAIFTLIIIRALYIAYTSRDNFGTLLSAGIAAMIGYHVIQNIGMAIGVMPITGIPLFFLSYGGSSLWAALISIGLLLSIHFRRYRN